MSAIPEKETQMNRQINYKTMRVVVGAIAILLAPVVFLLAGSREPLTSISISYWTDARDIFVGSLIAVGFFLFAYNGSGGGKDLEFYLSKLSCVFAICVALFPTEGFDINDMPPVWAADLAGFFGLKAHHVHYGAAVLLFVCLIAMMWFFSVRAKGKGETFRAYTYRAIGILMVVGILVIMILGSIFSWTNKILLVEIWELELFGIGWLIAGTYRNEAKASVVSRN
jgi:hypothetical protein